MIKHEVVLGPFALSVTADELKMILDDAFDVLMEMTGSYEEVSMAEPKKKASKKPSKPKKAGFVPKIKSTKRNGLGTY